MRNAIVAVLLCAAVGSASADDTSDMGAFGAWLDAHPHASCDFGDTHRNAICESSEIGPLSGGRISSRMGFYQKDGKWVGMAGAPLGGVVWADNGRTPADCKLSSTGASQSCDAPFVTVTPLTAGAAPPSEPSCPSGSRLVYDEHQTPWCASSLTVPK